MRLVLLLFILMSIKANAQLSEQNQIKQVMNQQVEDWNSGNIKNFMKGYWNNDSLRFIGKRGITYGWKPVLDNYLKSYPDKAAIGKLKFENLSIDVLSDNAAFVTGQWTINYVDKDSVGGWFSLLFKRIDEVWIIVADHTS
jgi:hypothetical protein